MFGESRRREIGNEVALKEIANTHCILCDAG